MTQQAAEAGTSPTLRELMSAEVVTLAPDDTLRHAVEVLADSRIGGAPVMAGTTVVGVVSGRDILEFESVTPGAPAERPDQVEWGEWGTAPEWSEGEEPPASYFLEQWQDAGAPVDERFREISGPEWDVLAEHTVAEVMTRRVCALPPETPMREAAASMLRAGVHRVLVMEGDRLLGVVSTTDIVRAVSGEAAGSPVPVVSAEEKCEAHQ